VRSRPNADISRSRRKRAGEWRYYNRFGSADDPLLLIMGISAGVL